MRQIDVLYFSGCPNVDLALSRAREAIQRSGAHASVSLVEIEDAADATDRRFLGSPSVRVDGVDVEIAAHHRDDFGLQCRVYPVAGRFEGAPPAEWIVAALEDTDGTDVAATMLANLLRASFPAESASIFVSLVRQLALGSPVAPADVARATGRSGAEVDEALARVPSLEYADGKIVGAALTLHETRHAFEVEGRRLYTWCALDALVLPAILGKACRVISSCPSTGERILIQVAPDGIADVKPATAVMSGVVPTACGRLRETFCDQVLFFASPAAGQAWSTERASSMAFLSVDEAFRLGCSVARQLGWVGTQARTREAVGTKAIGQNSSQACGCAPASTSTVDEPLICTLASQDQSLRAIEFREVFAYLTRTEPLSDGFRWWFRVQPGLESRVRDLARREHECCRFFDFRIDVVGDAIVWEARTHEQARPILEELMRLPETLRAAPDVEAMKRSMGAAGLSFVADAAERSGR